MTNHTIRLAETADIPDLRAMQERSLQALGAGYYASDVPQRFVERFGTMDFSVVEEGHYFVCTDAAGCIVGSGGWSRQPPGYHGVATTTLPPDVATVRGVFTDPSQARRGIARAIMRRVEADALDAGFARLDLTATLSGVGLYERLGYAVIARRAIDLGDGVMFGCVDMTMRIAGAQEPQRRTRRA